MMTTIGEVLRAYDRGVVFRCGCEKRGLDPRIQESLVTGRITVAELMTCPIHRERVDETATAERKKQAKERASA